MLRDMAAEQVQLSWQMLRASSQIPCHFWVQFKVLIIIFTGLHVLASGYLQTMFLNLNLPICEI